MSTAIEELRSVPPVVKGKLIRWVASIPDDDEVLMMCKLRGWEIAPEMITAVRALYKDEILQAEQEWVRQSINAGLAARENQIRMLIEVAGVAAEKLKDGFNRDASKELRESLRQIAQLKGYDDPAQGPRAVLQALGPVVKMFVDVVRKECDTAQSQRIISIARERLAAMLGATEQQSLQLTTGKMED